MLVETVHDLRKLLENVPGEKRLLYLDDVGDALCATAEIDFDGDVLIGAAEEEPEAPKAE